MPALSKWVIGELFGTFLLVFFGCGSVYASVLTGAHVGVFPVAIVSGCESPSPFTCGPVPSQWPWLADG